MWILFMVLKHVSMLMRLLLEQVPNFYHTLPARIDACFYAHDTQSNNVNTYLLMLI